MLADRDFAPDQLSVEVAEEALVDNIEAVVDTTRSVAHYVLKAGSPASVGPDRSLGLRGEARLGRSVTGCPRPAASGCPRASTERLSEAASEQAPVPGGAAPHGTAPPGTSSRAAAARIWRLGTRADPVGR